MACWRAWVGAALGIQSHSPRTCPPQKILSAVKLEKNDINLSYETRHNATQRPAIIVSNHSKNKSGLDKCHRRPELYANLHGWRVETRHTYRMYLSQNKNIFFTLHKDAKTKVGNVAPPSIHLSIQSDTSRASR